MNGDPVCVSSLFQVVSRLGSPIKGYGQESRNRAARQRIANNVFTDEDGVEHIQVRGRDNGGDWESGWWNMW